MLEHFRASGLNARTFCTREGLGYASFCAWRRKLAEEPAIPATTSSPSRSCETAFIDLGAVGTPATATWTMELALGGGVVLRLQRR